MKLFKSTTTRRKPAATIWPIIINKRSKSGVSVSISTDDLDADDECTMSTGDSYSTRPHSAVPSRVDAQGPYCPRRPTLAEILADEAKPPWTLSAFTAYSSQNHCVENLEFVIDAKKYEELYTDLEAQSACFPASQDSVQIRQLQDMWKKLLNLYIRPNGLREVNLPGKIRSELLATPFKSRTPPSPEHIKPASATIYELMEDSILFPFLNEMYQSSISDEHVDLQMDSREKSRPPSGSGDLRKLEHPLGPSPTSSSSKRSPTSSQPTFPQLALRPSTHVSLGPCPSSNAIANGSANASASGIAIDGTADDSGSVSCPSKHDSMSPHTTPPTSDFGSRRESPRSRNDTGWKKMGKKLGLRKRSSGNTKEATKDERFSVFEE